MADNTTLNPGAGGDISAADDIDGVKYQRVKLTLGSDGVNDGDLSATNPMPVAESGPLITLFVRLLNLMGAPLGYDKSISRSRVTAVVESGALTTVATVTTVTAVNNISTVDTLPGRLLINGSNAAAWAMTVRNRIT